MLNRILQRLLCWLSMPFSRNKLTVLIYHQVLDEPDPYRSGEPDKNKFDWQMSLLKKYFNPVSIHEALALLKKGQLPANSVCVTFDDGYLNNLEIALPVLKKYDVPATVFVASAFSKGKNMWNDRVIELFAQYADDIIDLSAANMGKVNIVDKQVRIKTAKDTILALKYFPIAERLAKVDKLFADNGNIVEQAKMMSPEQVKQLADAGIEIGSHTHNHPILKGLAADELTVEIEQNKSLLEKWIGKPVRGFAYPNGKPEIDFDEHTVQQIKSFDFDYAVTTQWGYAGPNSDPFLIRRFTPWDNQAWKFQLRMLINLIRNNN